MHSPQLNSLLALLPTTDYGRLLPHLELVGLESGKVLFETGQKYTALYFPTTCTVSAQIELANGNTSDICMLGKQGVFGLDNQYRSSFFRAIVRKPGLAYRCHYSVYMREISRSEDMLRFTVIATRLMMEAMAAGLICRTFHSLGEQVASWLLGYGQDAAPSTIGVTHAQLASALGVRRERVTVELNKMARHGWLSLHRGHIGMNDYPALRKFACYCYAAPAWPGSLHELPPHELDWLPMFLQAQPA